MSVNQLHLFIGSLMGFSGTALLAAASHYSHSDYIEIAGQILLFHAPVLFGATALRNLGLLMPRFGVYAVTILSLGLVLFAADLTIRGFYSHSLFPFAAPIGGSLLLLGWLSLSIATFTRPRS
jgi:uncharacterized membrane protein YgdD (TMEM256/DUF423 family)